MGNVPLEGSFSGVSVQESYLGVREGCNGTLVAISMICSVSI